MNVKGFSGLIRATAIGILLCLHSAMLYGQTAQEYLKLAKEQASKSQYQKAESLFKKALRQAVENEHDPNLLADILFARQFNFQNIGEKARAKESTR